MAAKTDSVAVLEDEVLSAESKALWVFAYGSLCWKPGFDFRKAVMGHVQGFHRRFWQGNTTHRGSEDKPGRVATLVEHQQGLVHGVALAISGAAAIPYLSKRECDLGGYTSSFSTFYPITGAPFKILVYIASPSNPHWMGEASVGEIAEQIVDCQGPSGYNAEYVLRLSQFMKHHFPKHHDPHLYGLEEELLARIRERNLCLQRIMGDGEGCVNFVKEEKRRSSTSSDDENAQRVETFEHTTRIPEKALRCLNI